MKKLIFVVLILLSGLAGAAQTTTIYRADSWENISLYKSAATASEHPIVQQVSVTISGTMIKTNLGGRLFSYRILKTTHPSGTETDFSVMMKGKKYIVRVVHDADVYAVSCLDEWALHNITEVTSFN